MGDNTADSQGHHIPHFHFKPPPGYTGHDMTEPLDLSKIKIGNIDPVHVVFDDNEADTAEDEDDEMNEEEEERFTRGRSRSRSVHSNDDDGNSYSYGAHTQTIPPSYNPEETQASATDGNPVAAEDESSTDADPKVSNNTTNVASNAERTGPLQHREVVALQKGLEEAQQSISKNSREDEEERMAADAEKRKRMLAANHQASSSSNEPFKRFKLLLLGDSAVGKSSLILRWTMDTFSANLTSTVGVNFKSKKVQCYGEWIQVQVWDTSGQENFRKITTSYYRGAQGIMLVYDVTEKKSLDNVAYWIKNIKAHASDSVQIVLVGNKIDLRADMAADTPGIVTTEMGRQVAQKFGVPFFETSAKASNCVEDSFMTLVAAIAQSNPAGITKSTPGSPVPGSGSNSINSSAANSPLVSAGSTVHTNNSNTNNNTNNGNGNSQSPPPPDNGKKGFFSALRRRSSGGGGSVGSPDSSGSAAHGGELSSPTSEGADGDKEKCIVS